MKKAYLVMYHGIMYYLLVGFLPLFLLNLILRQLVWPFFSYSLLIPAINFLLGLVVLFLAIKYFSPYIFERIEEDNRKQVWLLASIIFVIVVGLTSVSTYGSLTMPEMIMQIFFSSSYVALFVFFSYNNKKIINSEKL